MSITVSHAPESAPTGGQGPSHAASPAKQPPAPDSGRVRATGWVARSVWRPLEVFAARMAERDGLPEVDPDDFVYEARTWRRGLPDLHSYRHFATRRFLHLDPEGIPFRYAGPGAGPGGYAIFDDPADALASVELALGNQAALRLRRNARDIDPEPSGSPELEPEPAVDAGAEVETGGDADRDADGNASGDADRDADGDGS